MFSCVCRNVSYNSLLSTEFSLVKNQTKPEEGRKTPKHHNPHRSILLSMDKVNLIQGRLVEAFQYFLIITAYSISEPLQSNTNIISWHKKLCQSFPKGKSWKWRSPTPFLAKCTYLFQLHNFSLGSWPHFKKTSLPDPAERCRRRAQQPHEGRRARSPVLADMSSDKSGWRVAIPGQARGQREWPGPGTDQAVKGQADRSRSGWELCAHTSTYAAVM